MDIKHSLKSDNLTSPIVLEIKKELNDLGFNTEYFYGNFRSYYGSESNIVIDAETFSHLCLMLHKTRKQLQEERKKKWWKFWK